VYALNSVHLAIFYKNLEVKIIRLSSIISSLVTGIIGIILAFSGFGVWSLIYSGLVGAIVSVVIVWSYSAWRPKLIFRITDIKKLMPFGIRVFLVNYLDQVYSRLDVLVIGKIFDSATLGQYFRASSFNQMVTKYTSQGLSGVFFPIISRLQDNLDDIRRVFTKSLHTICFLSFFLTGFLFINAEPLIVLLFSSKWYPAVHYFQILAFSSYIFPMTIIFNGVLLGTNHSSYQLKLELVKKGIGVLGLGIGFLFGLEGYLWSLVITATLGLLLSLYFVQRAINLHIRENLKAIYSYVIPLIVAGSITLLINRFLTDNLWFQLIINSSLFISIYIFINHVFKKTGYVAAKQIVGDFILSKLKK